MTNQLYALDSATGAQIWSLALGLETYVAPAIGAGRIVYAGSSLTLMALAGATGNRRWESAVGGYTYSLFSSPAVGIDGTLYVSTGYNYLGRLDGYVYALDGATGTNKWAFRTGQTSRSSPALGSDGTVYVGADDGNFYALDGATGARKWGIQTGGSAGSPAVGADGTVYVGSGDGKVYALAGGAGLAPSPWPKFRGDARNTGSRQHLGPPRVMAPPTNALVGVGVPFALEAMAEGAQPLSYTWFFNGAPLSGATNSVLSFASFDATNAGLYRVRVANALGSVECPDISLVAGGQIAVEIVGPGKVQRAPAASLLPLGTVVELTAQPDAGRPFRGWSGDVEDTNLVLRCAVGRSVRLRATFGYQPGELKWIFEPGGDRRFSGGESGSPAMGADGTLYVYSETLRFRSVYAVDGTTGAKKWEARIGGEGSVSSLVGPDGTVYVYWNMGGFCAMDGATGNTRWTAAASAGAAIGPEGTLYLNGGEGVFHADNGKIYAFDGAGGQKKWEFAAPIGSVSIGADGTLYVGFNSAGLYALNPTNGVTNWVFAAGGQLTSPAIGSDGTLFCGSTDKKAYAVNGSDGTRKWECPLAAPTWSPPVLGTDGTVYVATCDQDANWDGSPDDSSFYALDGLTGKVKWEYSTGGSFFTTPAVSAEGTVYVSGTPNQLYAVDGATGGIKWAFTTGTARASAPTIGADGTVYVTQNGTLWALQGDGGLARSAWPKFQGDAQNTGAQRLPGAPRILTQTPSQTVREGLPFTLEVVADGRQPRTFEWYCSGTRLPEAAGSFLHFAAFNRTNAGTYRVRVSNTLGSVDSPDIIVAAGAEITVDVTGPGQVTRSPLGTLQPLGTSIELVAQPDDGQWFLGWTGDLEDTNRVLRFTADRSLRLQAVFGRPPGTLKWTFRPGGQPSSSIVENGSPAIGPDGTVYFSQTFGKLYAVDGQTGAKKWEAAVRTRSFVVVGDDGTVYVPSDMDVLRAFDGATGNLKWTGPGNFTIMLSSDGTVFGTSMPGALYANSGINALDSATGQLKWSFPSDELRAAAPLTMGADGTLYFVYFNLYAMDSTNGKRKWVYPIASSSTTSPALGADGTLFIGEDNKLVALQGTDGAKKWQSVLAGTVSAAPSLGTDGTVFVGTTAGTLYALDPVTGNQVWASPTAGGIVVSPAISASGTIYFTCSTNRLLAINSKTGGKIWEYTSSDAMSSAPAIGADGTVYVAANSILWAFQGDQGLADSPWPKFQGNARNHGNGGRFAAAPKLVVPPHQMIDELATLRVTNTVAGLDPATNSLSFALITAPPGVQLEPATGILTWTPDETQGPGNYQITVMVSNSVAPLLMLTNHFTVAVGEVNRAPVLTVPPPQIIDEFSTLVVTNVATDADLPANTLTFGLVSGPAGVQLDATSGVLTWTPTEAQAPSTNVIVVKVADDGIPSLSDTNRFTVVVPAVNRALALAPMADQIVNELTTLTVTNRVSDANISANRLSYDVVTAPAGVELDRASGVLSWTPTEAQGPSTNAISVKVFYNDEPSLSATQSFQVRVNEVNQAPHLTTAIRSLTGYGGQKLAFTNTATDADWPTNALAFLLDSDAPTGAQLDRITGVFRWTAPAVTAPQTDRFTVWVTDDGEPWKSDSGKFTVVTLPAPADLRLRGIQWVAAGVVRITWETSPGARYQLQSTARLDAPAWVSAGDTITATADTASQANACGTNTQSYFRVLRVAD